MATSKSSKRVLYSFILFFVSAVLLSSSAFPAFAWNDSGERTTRLVGRGERMPYPKGPQEMELLGLSNSPDFTPRFGQSLFSAIGKHPRDRRNIKLVKTLAPNLQDNSQSPESKLMEGQKLFEQGTPESLRSAVIKLKEVAALYKASGEKLGEAAAHLMLGFSYSQLDEKQNAVESLNKAIPLLEQTDDVSLRANAFAGIGMIHAAMGNYKKGVEFLEQALPHLQSLNNPRVLAGALTSLGAIYGQLGERRRAIEYFDRALLANQPTGDRAAGAVIISAKAAFLSEMGDYQKALELYNQIRSLPPEFRSPTTEALTLIGMGVTYQALSEWQKAIEYFDRGLDFSRRTNDRTHETSALNRLGAVYFDLGERTRALNYFNQALSIAQAIKDRQAEASILTNLARFYISVSELPRALQYFDRALAIARSLENIRDEAAGLCNIAHVYRSLNDTQKALEYYNQGLTVFRRLEDRNAEAETLQSIGYAYSLLHQGSEALAHLAEALKVRRSIGDRVGEATTLVTIGQVSYELGQKNEALSNFEQALPTALDIKDRYLEAITLNSIGMVYDSLGENDKAFSYYYKSLEIVRALEDYQGIASALSNIGLSYEHKKDTGKALEFYLQSLEQREKNRASARLEEFKTKIASRDIEVYTRAVLLDYSAGHPSQAFNLTERARARTFLDQLGNIRPDSNKTINTELVLQERLLQSEMISLESRLKQESTRPLASLNSNLLSSLENQLSSKRREYEDLLTRLKVTNPEYASLTSVNTLTLSEVQNLIREDTTLLSYFVTPDKTVAFVIGKDSFQAVEIAVKEADLKAAITWFRSFPSLRDPQPHSLEQLYSWLIAPVRQYIKSPVVGVIPHGVLHYLPFAALTDGKHYFGDDFTLFYLPSASVLPFIQNKSKPVGTQVLAVAQGRAQGLSALRYADAEAESVAGLFNTKAMTTGSASKSDFLKRAGDYSILHIAAHARLNTSSPLFSRIILGNDKEGVDALEVREVYDLDLSKSSLAVLSGCNTQLGAHSKGDDIVGLNRAFIYAGAPTVIASLWTVDDESTSYLMRSFYTHLKQGIGKAEALRAAQSETRKKYSHPYYWASFVLSGDPGQNVKK
jgi:CHAT domain-containing protein/lipopolysaccharide biosynthesis regulator YciM